MDNTLTQFIQALRNADVRISPAETLDAFTTVELVGYRDRDHLKRSLALVLPKTVDEKDAFDACFDQFFKIEDINSSTADQDTNEDSESESSEAGNDSEGGGGDADADGKPTTAGEQSNKKKKKPKKLSLIHI